MEQYLSQWIDAKKCFNTDPYFLCYGTPQVLFYLLSATEQKLQNEINMDSFTMFILATVKWSVGQSV